LQITPLTAALEDEGEEGPLIFLDPVIDSSPTLTTPAEGALNDIVLMPKSSTLAPPASAVPGSVAASRSVSPAPSLEAILLDRKRRLAAAGSQNPLPAPAFPTSPPCPTPEIRSPISMPMPRVATPNVKGTRFKSSPLGGFDSHGVVVAEKVKQDIRNRNGSQEYIRIPHDKDKVGPDKEDDGRGS